MKIQGWRPCRTQGCSDLPCDQPTLPHARNNDPPRAAEHQIDGALKRSRHRTRNPVRERSQRLGLNPYHVLACILHREGVVFLRDPQPPVLKDFSRHPSTKQGMVTNPAQSCSKVTYPAWFSSATLLPKPNS